MEKLCELLKYEHMLATEQELVLGLLNTIQWAFYYFSQENS